MLKVKKNFIGKYKTSIIASITLILELTDIIIKGFNKTRKYSKTNMKYEQRY